MIQDVSSANMNKGTILVVDDVPENLRLLDALLTEHNYTVHTTVGEEETLGFIKSTTPDLILFGATTPDMDRYAICQRIRTDETTASVPIILMLAADGGLDRDELFSVAGTDYVLMPFQADEILARIDLHLSLQHLRKVHEQDIKQQERDHEEVNARLKLEISRHQRTVKALNTANRAYKTVSGCNQALIRAKDEMAFLQEICRVIIDAGGYLMAWIGYAHDDTGKTIQPQASAGAVEGYLDELDITWADTARGRNPISAAIRTGQPGIAQHILTTSRQEPWRVLAQQRGYASMIALPLHLQDGVLGALCIYSSEPDAFDDDETRLLMELGEDVTYGILALRTQVERNQAEDALRESEHFTKTVLSSVGEGVIVYDRQMCYKSWNRYMEALTGYAEEEVLGQCALDIFPHVREQGVDKMIERALTGETVESPDIPYYVPRTGKTGWVSSVYTPHLSVEGEIMGVVATIHDITERKTAERTLADERNLLRTLIDNVPDYIFVKDRQGRFMISNVAHAAGAGLRPDDLVGKVAREAFPGAVAEQFHDDDEQVMQTGQALINEERVTTDATGNPKWVLTTKVPLRDSQGEVIGLVGVSRDITDRKRAQEALQESEQSYRSLYRQAQQQAQFTESLLGRLPVGVLLLTLDGQVIETNPKLRDMVGYSENELKHQTLTLIRPEDQAEADRRFFQAVVEGNASSQRETEYVRKDGSRFPARIRAARLEDVDGKIVGILSTIEDITQTKAAEEARHVTETLRIELEKEKELRELKTRFVSMASHEFRTPLATIQATSETLQYYFDKMSVEQREQRFEKIREQIRHVVTLLDDVLTIGKIEGDAMEFAPETIDLNDFFEVLVQEFRESNPQQPVFYTCEPGGDCATEADKKLLRQIVTNLISNAIKYSPTNNPVQIQMDCSSAKRIVFKVIDTGIGIPEEDQKRLFTNFFRASNTTGVSGTGLGLAIVKHATDLHGGKITFTSQENVGTTFTVVLPRTRPKTRKNEK
jgi:PAS domain S-box-containing protein